MVTEWEGSRSISTVDAGFSVFRGYATSAFEHDVKILYPLLKKPRLGFDMLAYHTNFNTWMYHGSDDRLFNKDFYAIQEQLVRFGLRWLIIDPKSGLILREGCNVTSKIHFDVLNYLGISDRGMSAEPRFKGYCAGD